jgi:sugar-specific transcriptional regulator TrmB
MRNEPLLSLPKDLQDKRWALRDQKTEIEKQIKELEEQIKERRRTCAHERPKDLTGYEYAVYCAKCGEMIDSWL